MKTCYVCKLEKSNNLFYNNKTKYDGLTAECKSCKDKQNRLRQIENPNYVNKLSYI